MRVLLASQLVQQHVDRPGPRQGTGHEVVAIARAGVLRRPAAPGADGPGRRGQRRS